MKNESKKLNIRDFHPIKKIFSTRMGIIIFSVVTAIVVWFAISIGIYPTTPRTINHIPLVVDITGTAAELNGYSVIDYPLEEVSVQIEGDRSQIGNLEADDLLANAVIGNITSSGVKTLDITISSKNGVEFTVKSISPNTINVNFDKIVTKTFDIQAEYPNIKSAESCLINTEQVTVTNNKIEVTGPEQVMNKIDHAVAVISEERVLTNGITRPTNTLEFRDVNGGIIEDEHLEYEKSTYLVQIPVLYSKQLDVTYQLRNVPSGFDEKFLRGILNQSVDKITLAAPDTSLEEQDEFTIGSISLNEIGLDFSKDYLFDIPENYENQSGITSMNLSLDSEGLVEKTFIVSEISVINGPSTYNMEVVTEQLSVTVVGPESQINQLSASDLIVNVDLLSNQQEDFLSGSFTPVISCQKFNRVWAVGDYSNKVYIRGTRITADSQPVISDNTGSEGLENED